MSHQGTGRTERSRPAAGDIVARMEWLAERLAGLEGVVAVALGGSRAQGTHGTDSDWDFGLYCRGTIDPEAIRALGYSGEVALPGTEVIEFSPAGEYDQTMAVVSKNLEAAAGGE